MGAGPGDPGLLTLRGAELLRDAEVVVCDGLVSPELRALAPDAEIIHAGKHDRLRCVSQEAINALLLAKAREGRRVVRLKGGDPYLFGRGGEEAEVLAQAGIPFEVIPGVSSIQAVPACAGIPLTHRRHNSSVTLVTGHEDPASPANRQDWARLARLPGTLVILMGLKNLPRIAAALLAYGRSPQTPAAVISEGTTDRQRTVTGTLSNIAGRVLEAGLAPPALVVVGEVVGLRDELDCVSRRPLAGRRVVVTQRRDLAQPMVAALREQGAGVLEIPATRWGPPRDAARLDKALSELQTYDWILFSNPQGVGFFFQRFFELHPDVRALGNVRLGAYGPRTGRELRRYRVAPAAVAADHKTPLILDAVSQAGGAAGCRVLVLRGDLWTEEVPEALARQGAQVDVVTCYSVEPEREDAAGSAARLIEEGADWILFASGLAIEHFHARFDLRRLKARFPSIRLALGSPTIVWALEELGLKPSLIAKPDDIPSMIEGLIAACADSTSPGAPGPAAVPTPAQAR